MYVAINITLIYLLQYLNQNGNCVIIRDSFTCARENKNKTLRRHVIFKEDRNGNKKKHKAGGMAELGVGINDTSPMTF